MFCFRASGCKQFLIALVRQPSFLQAEGLEKLIEEWKGIKATEEYKKAVEQSKKRTEKQTRQKADLQSLRILINKRRRKGQDTENLEIELQNKEENYGRGKQHRPPGAYLANNTIFSSE